MRFAQDEKAIDPNRMAPPSKIPCTIRAYAHKADQTGRPIPSRAGRHQQPQIVSSRSYSAEPSQKALKCFQREHSFPPPRALAERFTTRAFNLPGGSWSVMKVRPKMARTVKFDIGEQ